MLRGLHSRLRAALCAACLAAPAASATPEPVEGPINIGGLPGGTGQSLPAAISHDGLTVVGAAQGPGQTGVQSTAFVWTEAGGMVGLPLPSGTTQVGALGVSPDGTHVVGQWFDTFYPQAFAWSAAQGLTLLAGFPNAQEHAKALAVSADGSIVVGESVNGTYYEAVRWVNGGAPTSLGLLPGGLTGSSAFSLTHDGSVAAGSSSFGGENQYQAVRFEANGQLTPLGDLPGPRFRPARGSVRTMSADGLFLAGTGEDDLDRQAVRWTPWGAAPRGLGTLGVHSNAWGISDDGHVVVGDATGKPFIWDAVNGMRNLEDVLVDDYGVDLSAWFRLYNLRGISGDGRTLVGTGQLPGAPNQGFVVRLPPQCNDGLDNDGDGLIDHAADPDCSGEEDNVEAPDTDGDWWLDVEDNCPGIANPDQADADGDTRGDVCEHLTVVHRVPEDFATIQAAIGAAAHSDHVDVAPGTYVENLDFGGKLIEVFSRSGPAVTTIDGSGAFERTVTFENRETLATVLRGFTVTGGRGGIYVDSGATLEDNVIESNLSASFGGGIQVLDAEARIANNVIRNNTAISEGGALQVVGSTSTRLEFVDNLVEGNSATTGGGIAARPAPDLLIRNNRIVGNRATTKGGGVWLSGDSAHEPLRLERNLVAGNTAPAIAGIWVGSSDDAAPQIVQNTVAGNLDTSYPYTSAALELDVGAALPFVANNVFSGPMYGGAVDCNASGTLFVSNVFWSQFRDAWGPACGLSHGTNGNVDADPLLVGPAVGDYRLLPGSPAIDSGDPASAQGVLLDLAGNPRVQDGGSGSAVVDVGAYEFGVSECTNGLDDDGDGTTDAGDPGCGAGGSYEAPACDNGADDDGDGLVDLSDPGCAGSSDVSESSLLLPCDNQLDEDGDGYFDAYDNGCADPSWPLEDPACEDGVDNDGDFRTDFYDDPGCHAYADGSELSPTPMFQLYGVAQGGTLGLRVAGVLFVTTTNPGETASEITWRVANEIEANTELSLIGVTAYGHGNTLSASHLTLILSIDDPGLRDTPDPPAVPGPGLPALGGLVLALLWLGCTWPGGPGTGASAPTEAPIRIAPVCSS